MPGGGRFPHRTGGPLRRIQRTAERFPLWRRRKRVEPGPPVGPPLVTGRGLARRQPEQFSWARVSVLLLVALVVAAITLARLV